MATFPAFKLPASDGETYSKAALKGTPFVVFAYPKAMTPGCTTESCDFRDLSAEFAELG